MNRITWLIGLSALLVYQTGCSPKKKEKEEAGKYTVTSPLKMDTSFVRDYVSQIQSVRNIEVRAQEKGYLQTINVDEGQYVHAGQLLFRIMPRMYEAEVLKNKAAVKEAELEMLNTKTLADKNIVSKTELAMAQAKLDEAKAELSLAQIHLSLTEIRAPFDGIVDRIRFKQGSLIDEGGLLTTLSDNKSIYAYFNVSESEYLDYKEKTKAGQKQEVGLKLANGADYKYKGVIETVEGEFDNETGNIAFRAAFPNPKGILRHGETGNIRMPVSLKKAILIPQKATFDVLDKKFVYVVNENNVLEARQITIAQELPHVYIVASGLGPKDKILAEGLGKVRDKQKIKYEFVPFEKELMELKKLHAE